MDALSDVLGAIRLTGAVFLQMELRAQWSYLTAPARAIADVLIPHEVDHVIPYHVLLEGTCFARLLDGDFVEIDPGDVVMFPAGDRHVLATASDLSRQIEPTEITGESLSLLKRNEIVPFKAGDSGRSTRIVCGYLACDKRLAESILDRLPRLLRLKLRDENAAWMRTSIQYSVAQSASQRPGSAMVLARLSEVLFAEAIRQHMDTLPPDETGWLAALRDRYVGRTLALLHDKPAHPWTVDALAKKVGLSRSALGQRFVALIGKPPMEYLMRWRILLAARQLRESRAPVIQIASEVGYESEAAFNRAFKRELGVPPAAWRRKAATA